MRNGTLWRAALLAGLALATAGGALAVMRNQASPSRTTLVKSGDPGNPCGVVSATMVSHLLGKPVRLDQAKRVIHCDALGRSSMAEIAQGLEALGFPAVGVRMDRHKFQRLEIPAILHVDDSHFVVAIMKSDGMVMLYNPPDQPLLVATTDLSEWWDGMALLVGRDQSSIKAALATLNIAQ